MIARKKSAGQSLIEFALMLPLLLILVMGLFDIGRAVFYYSVLNTAVREGARFAIVQPYCNYRSDPEGCTGGELDAYPLNCADAQSLANTEICDVVTSRLFNISGLSSSTITINHIFNAASEPLVNIEIAYPFEPITPGLGLIGDMTIRANSQMLMTPIAKY